MMLKPFWEQSSLSWFFFKEYVSLNLSLLIFKSILEDDGSM